jgi:hypothetical protein
VGGASMSGRPAPRHPHRAHNIRVPPRQPFSSPFYLSCRARKRPLFTRSIVALSCKTMRQRRRNDDVLSAYRGSPKGPCLRIWRAIPAAGSGDPGSIRHLASSSVVRMARCLSGVLQSGASTLRNGPQRSARSALRPTNPRVDADRADTSCPPRICVYSRKVSISHDVARPSVR